MIYSINNAKDRYSEIGIFTLYGDFNNCYYKYQLFIILPNNS